MSGNDFMAWILRSPLHGMLSKGMMLITVTGRKTGKAYTIPVGYYEEDGYVWVLTSRDRTWWRNLNGGANVKLLLKHAIVCGHAETELGQSAVNQHMTEYVQHVPQAAKSFGIHIQDGVANSEDVVRSAKDRLFVRIRLPNQA